MIAGINTPPNRFANLITPPQSWARPKMQYREALLHPWYRALFEITDAFFYATVIFFQSHKLMASLLPITTNAISSPMGLGSDSLPVQVEVGGVPVYLADSMQFMLEYSLRIHPQRTGVYYVMPSFRGEDMDQRHLCQFFHSEAEIVGGLADVMSLSEAYLRHLNAFMLEHLEKTIAAVVGSTAHVENMLSRNEVFRRICYQDAIDELKKEPGHVSHVVADWMKITSAGEQELLRRYGDFIWLTHFPHKTVPFYQAIDEENQDYSLSADLLAGIGEILGSGERHQSAEQVRKALQLHEVDAEPYGWYIDMKSLLPLRTAGFGLGMERYILWLLQHDDIRDCQILSRENGNNDYV